MEITQQVIDVARLQLPRVPEGFDCFEKYIRVHDYEVGIGERRKFATCVAIHFEYNSTECTWTCLTGLDIDEAEMHKQVNDVGRGPKTEAVIDRALNVVEFKSVTEQPSENVIERLETALAMAKDGKITNIVMVATCASGDVMDCWANANDALLVVGGIETLKLDFMNSVVGWRD